MPKVSTLSKPVPSTQDENAPRYLKMARQLEENIVSGRLRPGSRLPSYAQMRRETGAHPGTTDRVYAALDKRGLIRREAKRGIFVAEPKASRQRVLQVVLSERTMRDSYYRDFIRGVHEEAHRRGAAIRTGGDVSASGLGRDGAAGGADGFIAVGNARDLLDELKGDVACVSTLETGVKGVPTVSIDDRSGIAESVWHLAALGHKRIAFMPLSASINTSIDNQLRVMSYREALREADIDPDPAWIWPLRHSGYEPHAEFVDMGYRKMTDWLAHGWAELGCTAVMAHNDETAIGVMQAFEDVGISVPGDVSLVGFDDIDAAALVRPRLTTVRSPLVEVGRAAVSQLMDQIEDLANGVVKPRAKRASVVLPPDFVIRESSGPPPGRS